MSPLQDGYYYRAENGAPLFAGGTVSTHFALALLWGGLLGFFVDYDSQYLEAILLSFLIGISLNLLWLVFIKMRYQQPIDDASLNRVLEYATNRIGFNRPVRLWLRNTEKLIFMVSSNPLFCAILISDTACYDLIRNQEDAEVAFAEKLLEVKPKNRLIQLIIPGITFLLGLFMNSFSNLVAYWTLLSTILPIQVDIILGLILIGSLILAFVYISSNWGRKRTKEAISEIYGLDPYDVKKRLFGGSESIDDELESFYFVDKEEQLEYPFLRTDLTDEVQAWVNKEQKYSDYVVRMMEHSQERSIVAFKSEILIADNFESYVSHKVLDVIDDPELLGILLISNLEHSRYRSEYESSTARTILPGCLIPLIVIIGSLTMGIFLDYLIVISVLGILGFVVWLLYFGNRTNSSLKRALFSLDREHAQKYPCYIEVLRKLTESGFIDRWGTSSLKSRLKRLDDQGRGYSI